MQSILFLVFILVVSVFAADLFTAKEARARTLSRRADHGDLNDVARHVTEAVRHMPKPIQFCLQVFIEHLSDHEAAAAWETFQEREDWRALLELELNRLGYSVHFINSWKAVCAEDRSHAYVNVCWDTDTNPE